MSTLELFEGSLEDEDSITEDPFLAHHPNNKLDLSGCLVNGLHSSTSFTSQYLEASTLVMLDLSRNQLKELPDFIGGLYNLEILDLQSNQLSKLPDAIGQLTHLTALNVSGNMLTALPRSIAGCKALKELDVGFNQLEHLPSQIGRELISLETLCLHSNKLAFLPPSICHLWLLKVLDLHFNKLQSLPLSIGNLRALQKLDLSNNFSDFGGNLPHSLGDMSSLVELDLSSNQVRELPDSIGALPSIRILNVDNNPLLVPPLHVVEHSMEAMLQYMHERWKASQDFNEERIHASSSGAHLDRSVSSCMRRSKSWLRSFLARGYAGLPHQTRHFRYKPS